MLLTRARKRGILNKNSVGGNHEEYKVDVDRFGGADVCDAARRLRYE